MDVTTAYCSACDQDVRVVRAPGSDDPHDLVCLEYGERCTGELCPLFARPRESARERVDPRPSGDDAPLGQRRST